MADFKTQIVSELQGLEQPVPCLFGGGEFQVQVVRSGVHNSGDNLALRVVKISLESIRDRYLLLCA